jgi:hypothetical protein
MKKGRQLFITPSIALQVILTDVIQKGGPYTGTLPFGHYDQSGSPVRVSGK